jgi:N-ethylmaleimide reductase
MYKHLSSPIKLGTLSLKNRVVLAAMTRMRTDPKTGIPNDLMVDYYSQRAGAGLILTECAAVSQRGEGFPGAGNFYNKQQADGWKRVVAAVKAKGAHIFAQLFHAGRNSHPLMNGNQ